MLSKLSRHISYANVTATLALVFSMSGAALAAHHYLINSTKQISPKVLKKLKGNHGPKGPTGTAGAAGAAGAKGATGEQGPSHIWNGSGETTATVQLPVGTYFVIGIGNLRSKSESGPGTGACQIRDQGLRLDPRTATVPDEGEDVDEHYGEVAIPDEATVTIAAGQSGLVSEECEEAGFSEQPVKVIDTTVTAIQVGGLN